MLLSRKRPHSPDPFDGHSCQRSNCCIRYILASESSHETDEGSESSYSVQNANTVSAKDTSDTSWSSEESVTMDVEFEEYDVASITHSEEKLMSNCDSSGSDDMLYTATAATVLMATNLHEDQDLWADSSDLDSDTTDSEVPRADYWDCIRCKSKCSPLIRYCIKCFQLRKGYFPERPKRTHPRRRKAASSRPGTVTAGSPMPDTEPPSPPRSETLLEPVESKLEKVDSGISMGTFDEPSVSAPDSTNSRVTPTQELLGSQETGVPPDAADMRPDELEPNPRSELCFMCVERPKNGAFVHSKTVHVLCCYQCSLKVWNKTRKCPLCNNKPQKVARLIFG